jgi:hypothetical protein
LKDGVIPVDRIIVFVVVDGIKEVVGIKELFVRIRIETNNIFKEWELEG